MITSVFILSITDMRNDKKTEKLFNIAHLGAKAVAVVMLIVYLIVYLKTKKGIFLSFVGPAVFFIIFLFLEDY